ncbi:UNKNOWN [Stylonychia lemnae]|uniref:Transmembrane protein n=1 Tax=Stylonychia lemnae TaxID=5949 RepID=A0A077ZZ65_STYLE|nr:UNKNOWN [Stylonychia lemnae]|eukprot:CDW75220.1 UNKNOWN [Stylonychia lemnae]
MEVAFHQLKSQLKHLKQTQILQLLLLLSLLSIVSKTQAKDSPYSKVFDIENSQLSNENFDFEMLISEIHDRIKLMAITPEQQLVVDFGYAFLNGFQADAKFQNSTGCFDRYTNITMIDLPAYKVQMSTSVTIVDKAVAITTFIQKLTNAAWVCNDCFRNVAKWTNNKIVQFGNVMDFFTGFLFNLLGKAIQLQTAYANIDAAQKNGTVIIVYQQLARMISLILDFSPSESASLRLMQSNDIIDLDEIRTSVYYESLGESKYLFQEDDSTQRIIMLDNIQRLVKQKMQVLGFKEQVISVNGIADIIVGFLNGTTLTSTQSSQNCESAIRFQDQGLRSGLNILITNFTVFGVFNSIDKFLILPYHWDQIADKCYDSIFDAMLVVMSYTTFLSDKNVLQTNLVYNFGLIYNIFKDLYYYFTDNSKTKIKNAFSAGFSIGSFFYYLFSDESGL